MAIKKWKTLDTKQLLKHPRITIHEDDVELPNGNKTTYVHFGEAHDAAMVIAIDSDGKILLEKEYSYPPDEILLQLPGGGIHKNETPAQAAGRELAEEANLGGNLKYEGWF